MERIFIMTISLTRGGAENQLMKLAIYLKKIGYDVKIICGKKENDFKAELEENDIESIIFNYKSSRGLSSLIKFIKINQPKVILSFMFGANIIGRLVKLALNVPLVTSVRCNDISPFYFFLYKLTYKIDTVSTFNSVYALNKFIEKGISVRNKSILINNAISITNSKLDFNLDSTFTLVSLAHFRDSKDYITLFEAIKIIKDNNLKINLYVLGHTYNYDWPQQMIKNLSIEDNVQIIGFVSNTKEYLMKSHLLVLSTLREGTPNAILEGMSHKLPIVSTRVPGCESLVLNAECGFLAEKKDPNDLAQQITKMMSLSKKERENLGQKGFDYVYQNYREEVVYSKWLDIIDKAQNGKQIQ